MTPAPQILIMDDDPQGQTILSGLIQRYGLEVECTDSCQAARNRLETQSYVGLVLDMWMKDGTASDLLTWLRKSGRPEPVVVVSDTADYDEWIDLVNKGAADLLAKPVVPGELKRALQMAMGEAIFNDCSPKQAVG